MDEKKYLKRLAHGIPLTKEARNVIYNFLTEVVPYLFGTTWTYDAAKKRITNLMKNNKELMSYLITAGMKSVNNDDTLYKQLRHNMTLYERFKIGVIEHMVEEIISYSKIIGRTREDIITAEDISKSIEKDPSYEKLWGDATDYNEKYPKTALEKEMDETCLDLHTIYNTNLIAKYPQNIQRIFWEAVKKHHELTGHDTPLTRLFKNYFRNKHHTVYNIPIPPTEKYIDGPNSLSLHYSEKFYKRIYIFGEFHGYENNCENQGRNNSIDITRYLSHVFNNTTAFIDFYIEYPARVPSAEIKNVEMDPGYIADMTVKFAECIDPRTRIKCPWNTVRMHFSDIRPLVNEGLERSLLDLDFDDYYEVEKGDVYFIENLALFYSDIPKYSYFVVSHIVEHGMVYKEISRTKSIIEPSFYKELITEYLLSKPPLDDTYAASNKKLAKARVGMVLTPKDREFLNIVLYESQLFYMDIYQLSRIFRVFKESKFHPSSQLNIIVYGGENHAEFLRAALDKLMFKKEFLIESPLYSRCLDMGNHKISFLV